MFLCLLCDELLDVVLGGGDVAVFVPTANRLGKLCCKVGVFDKDVAYA